MSRLNRTGKFLQLVAVASALIAVSLGPALLNAYEHGDAVPADFKMPDPLEPSDGLASFVVGSGLRLELVASEPLVADPIAIDWGPDGKLWVVEMADYPLGVDGKNSPGGRVRCLTDSDGDGSYDKSTVFLEGIAFPTSVKAWRNGVLVVSAPEIFYAEDRNGDGVADHRETLFKGFREGNQQHRVNGLEWSLDNRLVLANGDSGGSVESVKTGEKVELGAYDLAIDPDSGEMQLLTGRTQYGRVRDDAGNWFGCSNSHPLFHFVLPGEALKRNPHVVYPPSVVQVPENPHAPRVYPVSEQALRYNKPFARSRITSACGIGVQRDARLGEDFYGDVFVCEPVHNLVHRIKLYEQGSTFVGRRAEAEAESEILASSDPWSRPVSARTGPDGAMWIVDMYRFVIEHPEWIPEEWQKVLDLRAGADRGRIYRLVSDQTAKSPVAPDLSQLSPNDLVAALASDNGWQRDRVHQMLWWRRDEPEIAKAIAAAEFENHALARMHRLCLHPADAVTALQDADPRVRRRALQIVPEPGLDVITDDDPQVRLEFAFALGRKEAGSSGVGEMLAELANQHPDDTHLVAAVMSSVIPHFSEFAQALDPAQASSELRRAMFETAIGIGQFSAVKELLIHDPTGAFSELLSILDRRKMPYEKLVEKVNAQTASILDSCLARIDVARKDLKHPAEEIDKRIAAVNLVGRIASDRDADRQLLLGRLTTAEPTELQLVVVDRLAAMRRYRDLFDLVAKSLPEVQRRIVANGLDNAEGAQVLLEFLESKQLAETNLSAAQRDRLRVYPHAGVRSRARALFGDVDADLAKRDEVVEAYQPVLKLKGDADAGKLVFGQVCAVCHQLDGVGQSIGVDLAALSDKSAVALLVGILDPNRAVEDKYVLYTIETTDGGVLAGLLQEETGAGVRVALLDGQTETVLRSDIVAVKSSARSLMPEGLEAAITHQQMADLIQYLQTAGNPDEEAAR